jgi:hypothetical protein
MRVKRVRKMTRRSDIAQNRIWTGLGAAKPDRRLGGHRDGTQRFCGPFRGHLAGARKTPFHVVVCGATLQRRTGPEARGFNQLLK